eukprot:symbB.v1.2.037351.t2/scaffold5493.1/size26513/1
MLVIAQCEECPLLWRRRWAVLALVGYDSIMKVANQTGPERRHILIFCDIANVQESRVFVGPHLPGIPDKHGDVEYEQLPEGTQEVNSEPVLSLKTSELTRDESSGALRAWLSEELHRHNAAICKHLDEAFDRQLKSQR